MKTPPRTMFFNTFHSISAQEIAHNPKLFRNFASAKQQRQTKKTMAEKKKFKGFKEAVEWMVYMKKAMHEYCDKHGTTVGFDPYAVEVPAQV